MDWWTREKKVLIGTMLCVTVTGAVVLIYTWTKKKSKCRKINCRCVWICNRTTDWNVIEKHFLASCTKTNVLGLDCEWSTKDSKPFPVGLLQLATAEDSCLLVRLNKLHGNIPQQLRVILEDKRVLKLGVGIHNDALKLLRDHGIIVQGCLDLRYVADHAVSKGKLRIQKMGLQELAEVVAGVKLNKSFHIRCSDWDANELTTDQIRYAVSDAVVAIQIFTNLMRDHSHHFFSWRSQSLIELREKAYSAFGDFVDIPFKQKKFSPAKTTSKQINANASSKGYCVRKTLLYRNCHLLAPDGELLCTCDIKKLQWYLSKNLGEIVSENPLTVRLHFEPSGRPTFDNTYYTFDKYNVCVVCRSSKELIRKVVVPHEYRKHFPGLMKNSLSHDVLLLCVRCHKLSNGHDALLRQQLSQKYDAPIGSNEEVKTREDPELKKVKSAGRALANNRNNIPESRIKVLEEIVSNYYGAETLTEEILAMAANMETCIPNQNFISHGLKVVHAVSLDCGLVAFEAMWRQHFLDTMKPRCLPKMWSVDHNHERLAQQVVEMSDPGFDVSILGLHKN